jgi:hypothetical protein
MKSPAIAFTRRQAAEALECHPDSITDWMPLGLAASVVAWGGAGEEMRLDPRLVLEFGLAKDCPSQCGLCRLRLDQLKCEGDKKLQARPRRRPNGARRDRP